MPNEKDAEIKSRYEDYSVEELRAALDVIFDSTDEFSDSDVEKMDEIMAVLDKKDPLTQRYTAEESLKHFREYYREELSRLGVRNTEEVIEKEPEGIDAPADNPVVMSNACCSGRTNAESANAEAQQSNCCRKLFHTALIAAATVAVMVIVTVSAAAAGIDIWKWVPVWNGSTLQFVPETTPGIAVDIPSALKQLGIKEPLFPTWLPDGFILLEQQIRLEEPISLCAAYVHQDRTIIINIQYLSDATPALSTEKDDIEPTQYMTHNKGHLIFSNKDQTVSSWSAANCVITISGDISVDEMKAIIDSVYTTR